MASSATTITSLDEAARLARVAAGAAADAVDSALDAESDAVYAVDAAIAAVAKSKEDLWKAKYDLKESIDATFNLRAAFDAALADAVGAARAANDFAGGGS